MINISIIHDNADNKHNTHNKHDWRLAENNQLLRTNNKHKHLLRLEPFWLAGQGERPAQQELIYNKEANTTCVTIVTSMCVSIAANMFDITIFTICVNITTKYY